MSNFLQQGLTMDAKVRYLRVEAHDIAEIARTKHGLSQGALFYSTEAIVASVLLSSQIKGDERLTLQLKSENPSFTFICDIKAGGKIRAKISPKDFALTTNTNIQGYLFISKHNKQKELYRGITEIREQKIQDGLQQYFKNSGQIDSLMRISIQVSGTGEIQRAAGFLVERLPESPHSPSANSEEFYEAYQHLTKTTDSSFRRELDKDKVCGYDLFPLETTSLAWECRCSQERIESMLLSLGQAEIEDILKTLGEASVTCEFCSTQYYCSRERLQFLLSHFEEN